MYRWAPGVSFCVLSSPALQCVDPGVKWKAAGSLLLHLHTLRQDTVDGREVVFDSVAGQRGRQLGLKPAYNERRLGFLFPFS